jgi:hypothetical protein
MGDCHTTSSHKSLALLAFIAEYGGGCVRHTTRGNPGERRWGAGILPFPPQKLHGFWAFTTWECVQPVARLSLPGRLFEVIYTGCLA